MIADTYSQKGLFLERHHQYGFHGDSKFGPTKGSSKELVMGYLRFKETHENTANNSPRDGSRS